MIQLSEIEALIPKKCFEKNLWTSLYYMIKDLLILSTAFLIYPLISHNIVYLIPYWLFYGFFMWCLFVIGHDCGHGSFSDYKIVNDICGHICHSLLLVPFWPWAYSHRKHHLYHNHEDKDRSHPWLTEEKLKLLPKIIQMTIKSPLNPFVAYFGYLYLGMMDGIHIFPFSSLFSGSGTNEKIKCVVSSIVVFLFLYLMIMVSGSVYTIITFYFGSWIIFCFILFMTTYMQHHTDETKVYTDANWSYLKGAFETVDRKYGYGIDDMHHNISDAHVVHHLFFTKIPHYHLKEASDSIKPLLIENKLYKNVVHINIFYDFYKLYSKNDYTKWIPV